MCCMYVCGICMRIRMLHVHVYKYVVCMCMRVRHVYVCCMCMRCVCSRQMYVVIISKYPQIILTYVYIVSLGYSPVLHIYIYCTSKYVYSVSLNTESYVEIIIVNYLSYVRIFF